MNKTQLRPFHEQKKFLGKGKRYYGYISGVGAGKTFAGIIRTARNMVEWNPGEMGAIVAPTRQMVVNVIIPEMRDLGFFDSVGWEYKSAYSDEPGLHAPNGSRALILSADNKQTIERLRGLNLAWGWIDEEAVVDPRAREILMQRLRTGDYRNLYITTTPKGKNHTYDFFVGDVDATETTYGRATLYETKDRLAIVGVPTDANPHTPDDYKEAMSSDMPEDIAAQEVQGQFVEIGSGVLSKDMLNYVEPTAVPDRSMDMYIGVDIGVQADANKARQQDSDYWAAAVLAVDPVKGDGYLVDLRRQRGMTLREGLQWLDGIHREAGRADIIIESNQSQRFFFQEAKEMGLPVSKTYNTDNKEDRLIQLSIPFGNETIQMLDWGDDRWQDFVNEWLAFPDGTHDDCLDAVQIAVENAPINSGQTQILGGDMYGQEADDEDR